MIRAMELTIFSQAQIETESRFLNTKDTTQLRLLASRSCVHQTLANQQLPKALYRDSFDQEAMKMRLVDVISLRKTIAFKRQQQQQRC